jgi:integrase
MTIYFVKGKGWRYDFERKKQRYTEAWFETKTEAKQAEARRREDLNNPAPSAQKPTDMGFLEFINLRLDHIQDRKSEVYYEEHVYKARKWVEEWGKIDCGDISKEMINKFLKQRRKVSPETANKEIRYLKAAFNWGIEEELIAANPVKGIKFFPEGSNPKYLPPADDIDKVISVASKDQRDYLLTLRETMGRSIEINRLQWRDVFFKERYVVLYTRKKKGGHLQPRKIPMTQQLYDVLWDRYENRDKDKPWVFWHRYWSQKAGTFVEGPYRDRKRFMKTLCRKAGVKYFRFHAIRHSGASILDINNISISSIQRILGHENRTTTEIYLHSVGESEREAMDAFERAREKPHTKSHTAPEAPKKGQVVKLCKYLK